MFNDAQSGRNENIKQFVKELKSSKVEDDLMIEKNSENTLIAEYNNADSVNKIIRKEKQKIAALIIEPVAGNMGLVLPNEGFLNELREITSENEILLIFDEVITGFRASYGGAQKIYRINPDLTTFGKIVGGGTPAGAFGGKKEIMDMLAPDGNVYQAGTLSGNPLTTTAGIETLKILRDSAIYKRLEKETNFLSDSIRNKAGDKATINNIASMFTIFFNKSEKITNYKTAKQSNTETFAKFHSYLLKNGIYFPPSQFESCFISTAHSGSQLEYSINKINSFIKMR